MASIGWLAFAAGAATVHAQDDARDAAGRRYFERGREAFDRADYETALVYFQHAYALSARGELQYNIGIAASRLQREEEALEAFRRYLEETDTPPREAEVRQRIQALERSIAEREATALALREATTRETPPGLPEPVDGQPLPRSAIVGASALAAVGVAGVAAMGVGLSRDGRCRQEAAGVCVVEQAATAWTWVYGGVGLAALAGSAAWFGISAKRRKPSRSVDVSLSPAGLEVSGSF
jgi:tetratricopeptide (TPR) repeat protein